MIKTLRLRMVKALIPCFSLLLLASLFSEINAQSVTGKVFRDFDASGQQTTASPALIEPGVPGVTVRAFNAAGTQIGVAVQTGLDGTYQSLWEEKFSLRELAKSPKLNDNHKLYLRLLLGEVDEGFVNFMGGPYSNLFDEDYSAYTSKVCEYLGLSKTRSASFLQSLQKHL